MYSPLKKLLKFFLPKKLLFRLEPVIRMVVYLFYKGNDFSCTVCDARLKRFVDNFNRTCPKCGATARDRRLFLLLSQESDLGRILDFSPSRAIYRAMKRRFGGKYNASDISGDFVADFAENLTALSFPNEHFDTIVCYHVLEHIVEDKKAMSELHRVLSPNGRALIQTPFKEGDIYEDYSVTTAKGRLAAFGQEDHVRVYSVTGLVDRLESVGFKIKLLQFEEKDSRFVLKAHETVINCLK